MGLTQAHFADLLGVHALTVSKWERGKLTPSPRQRAMMKCFGLALRNDRQIGDRATQILLESGAVEALFLIMKSAFEGTKR